MKKWLLFLILGVLVAGCSSGGKLWQVRQITFDKNKNHDLDNNLNFSPDDQWLCYDTRPFNGSIADGQTIEKVNIHTGQEMVLYRVAHYVKHQGPGVGAASYFPHKDSVIFIHGPDIEKGLSYQKTRRVGAIVPADGSGRAVWADARDVTFPFTPGALRGGTHRHEPGGPNDEWVGFTYNDLIVKRAGESIGKNLDLRTIGVTHLGHPVVVDQDSDGENRTGIGFSVVVVKVVPNPKPGTDEISHAANDGWVGESGYLKPDGTRQLARAFLGKLASGKEEVFIVDIPWDITQPGPEGPLEGTPTSFPNPPKGTVQRRLTHTQSGCSGNVRSNAQGTHLAFLSKDPQGHWQIFLISPLGGKMQQATFFKNGSQSDARWLPDGKSLVCVANNRIYRVNVDEASPDFGKATALTGEFEQPPSNLVASHNGKIVAFNLERNHQLQIFVAEAPKRK
jgi:hypothetical protein